MWTPTLAGRRGPKYLQIVEALADDIAAGALSPGKRLPPHRELAYVLGISPNTTSRAYAEAVARGFLRGEVGRGTFVRAPTDPAPHFRPADMHRPNDGPVDLSRNLPSPGASAGALAETLDELRRSNSLPALLDYQAEDGSARHVDAAIGWMRRVGVDSDPDEAVITNGAQHAILSALMAVTRVGDLLLTEELTYAPVRAMADRLGLKMAAVTMDEDGLCPDHLAHLCRNRRVRALYLTPTIQTPTTATLPDDRRRAVAEIARQHDLVLIEDDVFGHLDIAHPGPIATYAPERTIYITTTSKCLAPGLRVGFIKAPAQIADLIRGAVNLSCWMPPPLMAEIAARWIADGTADRLAAAQRATAARRQDMVQAIFDGLDFRANRAGLHLWLKLPAKWSAEAFKAEAARRNVLVTEGPAFAATPGTTPAAVRLCLSHEPDEARLRQGLETLRTILDTPIINSALIL
ncbi:MAG: PLP-dependent aminotransferase family protein [Hyphomicrobiales bacterium]|nr:PLP-dependent aminotransferase family protein [Hyphomicrobiales bacterium]